MDGTLTCAIHDFDAIREQLGLPEGKPILESIAAQSAEDAAATHRKLDALEFEIAAQATQQPGAEDLLVHLQKNDCRLGILTRNGKDIAHATLAACGLHVYFENDDVVSRDCCAPKPDPAGVHRLMERWIALLLIRLWSETFCLTLRLDIEQVLTPYTWPLTNAVCGRI